MSWMQKLNETYKNCESMIGTGANENEVPLLPICHTTQKAQIEIVINANGNFRRARVIPKDEARTIIPCTESSGGRTSGTTPHPLCDKLQYIAGDYKTSGGDKKQCFQLSSSKYTKEDLEPKYFAEECQKFSNLFITDFLSEHHKSNPLDIFNELIKLPSLIGLIDKNKKLSSKEMGKANSETILLNKYKLIDLFPKTLAKTVTFIYLLDRWCKSDFSHPKAMSVLKYVAKANVIKDLIDNQILFLDKKGKLLLKRVREKENKNSFDIFDLLPGRVNKNGKIENWQADAFVRWEVESPIEMETKVWEDKTLWHSWARYYSTTKKEKTLCYVTGEEDFATDQHPAKLRNDGDKAKLISSNDMSGFTFRGRFLTANQACNVGFETTQKAHFALRWLISRQGYRKDGQAIVAWATSGAVIPKPTDDPFSILFDGLRSDEPSSAATAQELAIKLKNRIAGYGKELGKTTGVVVMGLDSATPGRMSIAFYRELTGSDFLERVNNWHSTCQWIHNYRSIEIKDDHGKKKKKYISFVGAPAPSDIAEAAYATNNNGKFQVDERLRKSTVERLLPCVMGEQQLPKDIVESAVRRASNRVGLEEWQWNKTLSIACALFRKYHIEKEYGMALDPNRKTRDYLYGRLLAIADRLEGHALYKAKEKRDTNAARYMQQFADRPNKTWRQIYLSLSPYMARLGGASYYKSLIDEIMCKFDPIEDFNSDKPLSGEFLLGYHCQRADIWKKKEGEEESLEQQED